jgi:hypothetical protein
MDYDSAKLLVIGIYVGFALLELGAGRFLFRDLSNRKDIILDGVCITVRDLIFGSAKLTRRRPQEFGVSGLAPIPWYRELVWPQKERRIETPRQPGDWAA